MSSSVASKPGQTAWDEVFKSLRPVLMGVAMRLCGNAVDANDLVQDTCERALLQRDKFASGSNERAWLVTIMHHLFIDRLRRNKRAPILAGDDLGVTDPRVELDACMWQQLTPDNLHHAVETLARTNREFAEVYKLHAMQGLSYTHIASSLRISPNTVGSRLARAREKLRDILSALATGGST